MKSKTSEREISGVYSNLISFLFFFIIAILSFVRVFFGTELSDEAYSVAEGWIVAEGGIPFITNWSQIPGGVFFTAPFCWLYFKVIGTTSGMFLFLRIASFAMTLLFVYAGFILLNKLSINKMAVFLYLAAYVIPFFHGLIVFRADRPAIFFSWLASLLIAVYYSFICNDISEYKYLVWAGLCSAISILAYAQMIVYCVFLFGFVVIVSLKRKTYVDMMYYIAGGVLAAVVVVGYLIGRGGFNGLILGLQYLVNDVAYFRLGKEYGGGIIGFVKNIFSNFGIVYILAYITIRLITSRGTLKEYSKIVSNSAAFIAAIVCIAWKNLCDNSMRVSFYLFLLLFLIVPLWVGMIRQNKSAIMLLFYTMWIPSGGLMIVTSISTYAEPLTRSLLLANGALLFIIISYYAIYEYAGSIFPKSGIYSLLSLSICALMLLNIYCYIYRDGEFVNLDTKVESGAYKGIYTTSERVAALEEIELIIRQYTRRDDYLLAMECVPFVYLMSDSHPCAPSSWDQSMYYHGFNEDALYRHYFEMVGREPTKIIYVLSEIHNRISIDDESYKFNEFVEDNYDLLYENRNIRYPIVIYTKKVGK